MKRHGVSIFPALGVALLLLIAALLFARIAHHAGLPAAAAIVLVGIAANGTLPGTLRIELTPATLAIFLPALIFEGAWSIDVASLRRTAVPIAFLAIPGVLFTAASIALAAHLSGGLGLPAACALGAMLSATDPVAVLALFRALRIPLDLRTIVEGESIANDGVAMLLVQFAVLFAIGLPQWSAVALTALYAPLGGVAIGIVVAKVLEPLLRRFPAPWVGIAGTFAIAYGSYVLATIAGASGIFASAAAGIALPNVATVRGDVANIERFWDRTAFIANAIVFLLVGLSIRFERLFAEPLLLGATVIAVAVSRIVLAAVAPMPGAAGFARGWKRAVALAGIRGGLSLALALGLPADFPQRPQIIDAVFAVVFFTVVVQGWTLAPMLRRTALASPASS